MNQPVHSRRPAPAGPAGPGGHQQGPAGPGGHQQGPAGPGGHQQGPEQRHLTVVERRARQTLGSQATRARLVLAGAAVAAVIVAFALVYLHVIMAQRQFRLDRLSAQVSSQQATYSRLRLQVAQLESPQQIIATAEGKLGMRQPSGVTYLSPASPLPAGGSLTAAPGVPRAASPAIPRPSSGAKGTVPAPAGDADWPQIKSQLAGSP